MMRKTVLAVLAAVVLALPGRAAYAYSQLIVLGDSLSDSGNVYAVTGQLGFLGFPLTPDSPYLAGRFSNGLNFADWLSFNLFGQVTVPYLAGGANFAVGGATTGIVNNAVPDLPISTGMQAQLGYYYESLGGAAADPEALYLVYGGSNDMFGLFESLSGTDPAGWDAARDQAVSTATGNVAGIIGTLYNLGARNFLVPNLADLGSTPRYRGGSQASFASETVQQFNAEMEGILGLYEGALPGLQMYRLDVFNLLNFAIASPGALGFTNVTDACYTGPLTGGPPDPCANPQEYVFWDDIHPSAQTHAVLGYFAYTAAVPEPQTYALMALGLVLILRISRRSGVGA